MLKTGPTVAGQIPVQEFAAQAVVTSIDPKSSARQTPSQSTTSNSTTGAARCTTTSDDRPHLSSTALAAKIAAAVVLPSSPDVVSVPVAINASLPQPADAHLAGTNRESSIDSPAIAPAPGEDRNPLPAHSEAKNDEQPQATMTKRPDAGIGNDPEPAAASRNAPDSVPADSSSGIAKLQSPSLPAFSFVNLVLPQIDILSRPQGNTGIANNDTQTIKAPDPNGAKSSDSADADGAARTSASRSASADSTNAGAAGADQANQHAPAGASQPAIAPSRSADSGAAPIQTIAAPIAPRESAAHVQTDAPADAARSASQSLPPQSGDAAATAINTARLIQSMSQTEMRVGMHSPEFGEISIRTAVSQQQMTAQISVDHSDLGNAISAHIPAMQEKLGGETGLKALVEVSQGSMTFTGDRGSSSPRQQQPGNAAPAPNAGTDTSIEAGHPAPQVTTWAVGNGYRLDIRA